MASAGAEAPTKRLHRSIFERAGLGMRSCGRFHPHGTTSAAEAAAEGAIDTISSTQTFATIASESR